MANNLKPLVKPELIFLAEVDGEPAALAITFLDFNEIVKKMNGSLFPFGWYHWLFGKGKVRYLRMFILGVMHEFQRWVARAVNQTGNPNPCVCRFVDDDEPLQHNAVPEAVTRRVELGIVVPNER